MLAFYTRRLVALCSPVRLSWGLWAVCFAQRLLSPFVKLSHASCVSVATQCADFVVYVPRTEPIDTLTWVCLQVASYGRYASIFSTICDIHDNSMPNDSIASDRESSEFCVSTHTHTHLHSVAVSVVGCSNCLHSVMNCPSKPSAMTTRTKNNMRLWIYRQICRLWYVHTCRDCRFASVCLRWYCDWHNQKTGDESVMPQFCSASHVSRPFFELSARSIRVLPSIRTISIAGEMSKWLKVHQKYSRNRCSSMQSRNSKWLIAQIISLE